MCTILSLLLNFGHKNWPMIVCGCQKSAEVLKWFFFAQRLDVGREDYIHSGPSHFCSNTEPLLLHLLGGRTFLCWDGSISGHPTGRIFFVLSSYTCHCCYLCEIVFLPVHVKMFICIGNKKSSKPLKTNISQPYLWSSLPSTSAYLLPSNPFKCGLFWKGYS